MSNRFVLRPRDGSIPYQKITSGRQWVGRVVQHATKSYFMGFIGKTEAHGTTAIEAFEEVVAKHLGFQSAAALRAKNTQVRQVTRTVNAAADHIASEFFAGNAKPFDRAMEAGPAGGLLALRGFTRSMRRK